MANKAPQRIKRPVPKYLVARRAAIAERRAAVNQQLDHEDAQAIQDFGGFLDIDGTRFGLWLNDDEEPQTYEVLTRAEFEQRVRLRAAVQQAQQPKADPTPRTGEKPLALAEGAG